MTGWHRGEPTLADVRAEFPLWHCFRAINSLYYAQYQPTGLQVIGEDPLDLRDQIKGAQARSSQDGSPLPARAHR